MNRESENKYNIQVYTCPKCKKQFANISNSAPSSEGKLCISCICEVTRENEKQ